MTTLRHPGGARGALRLLIAVPLLLAGGGGPEPCAHWTRLASESCHRQALADFWLARAKCANLPDPQQQLDCRMDAFDELADALELCSEQRDARLDLCAALGGGFYAPDIDPADFVAVIDNPLHPLIPGWHYVYEKETDEGIEQVDVVVTDQTKEILGVTCTVVHAIETLDGELVEDTFDWFAQDVAGNVWYFGELSFAYEDGELEGLEGSWEAGEDGAQPGIVMLAAPQVGDVYRQEFLIGEAEDAGAVLGLCEPVTVPYGSFGCCLQTEDFTPLEPGELEHKFYAPGVGLVLEVEVKSGERVELVSLTMS